MHDYIIVGAGSAGCVLANRLSEDPSVRVLLLEAGGKDRSLKIKIPAAFPEQFHTKLDWDFATEPEPHVDGRSLYMPRGKSLGGSSSMNAMLYVRGRPLDYDGWEAQGAPGWGYADVLPYFIKAEDNVRGASEYHGAGGPLHVAEQRSPRPLNARLLAASEAAGIPRIADYNGPEQDGVSVFQVTQRNGRRFSAADAYLRPALTRPNLEVRTNVTVLGIELERERAVGVRLRKGRGGVERLRAEREVLLCAGAIGSPQLLMLSGIGAPDELRAAGVEVRHELPGVGRNLQDHPFVTVIWEVSDQKTLYGAEKPKALAEWLARKSGKLSSTVAEVVAFTRTRGGLPAADIQFHMGAAYYEDHGAETYDGHCMVIAPTLVSPQARGRVWLGSGRPPGQAADHHQHAVRARRPAIARRGGAPRARDRRAGAAAGDRRQGAQAGASERRAGRARGRPAQAPDADLSPGWHRAHERHPRRGGRRLTPARARPAGPARDRRFDHAHHHRRQHPRPHRHDRRAGGRSRAWSGITLNLNWSLM